MKQTEIPEALAATLIHLLPKEKISISDIEDILKETLLIFKSIPLDIPKPKKGSDFYGYIYGRYLGNIILDAFGNGAKDK